MSPQVAANSQAARQKSSPSASLHTTPTKPQRSRSSPHALVDTPPTTQTSVHASFSGSQGSSPSQQAAASAAGASTVTPQSQDSSPGSASSSSTTSSFSSSSPSNHPPRRVKFYQLRENEWMDLGTGNCVGLFIEGPLPGQGPPDHDVADEGAWIVVRKEQEKGADPGAPPKEEFLLRTKVFPYPPGYDYEEEDDDPVQDGPELSKESREKMERRARLDPGGYQRQQDTLIVWTDWERKTDLALSFATESGCSEVWEFIKASRRWQADQIMLSPTPSPPLSSPSSAFPYYTHDAPSHGLPSPTLSNLEEFENALRGSGRTVANRERTAGDILDKGIIETLTEIHAAAEDLESLEDLHRLCRIMQTILLLNDTAIFSYVLRDDVILGVASILEYDPEFPNMKASYREHLADPSHFQEVVPIRSSDTLARIHQTHRLYYLKDVVLARVLEDPTFSMLGSMIYFNEVDIVNDLSGTPAFWKELFALFDDADVAESAATSEDIGPHLPPKAAATAAEGGTPAPSDAPVRDKRDSAILFLQQFCSMAKCLQIAPRTAIYRGLAQRGILRVVEVALERTVTRKDPALRAATVDILTTLVDYDPYDVRAYSLLQDAVDDAVKEGEELASDTVEKVIIGRPAHVPRAPTPKKKRPPLVIYLIDLFHTEEDFGLRVQMAEALRVLVDTGGEGGPLEAPPRIRQEDPDAEKFLQFFYDKCVLHLVKPILELPDRAKDQSLDLNRNQLALCSHLCDLLHFFVQHHTFRSKYFILASPVAINVAKLMQGQYKHVTLSAIRFFRACVGKADEFYNRFFMKHELFLPILNVAVAERGKDNLVTSACLEFFEYIRTSNAKVVINHLMEKHPATIRALAPSLKTMQSLITKWEQINEPPPVPAPEKSPEVNGVAIKAPERTPPAGLKAMDTEEEAYFTSNDSDDDDKQSSASLKRPSEDESAPDRLAKRSKSASSLVDYGDDETEEATETGKANGAPPTFKLGEIRRREESEDDDLSLLFSSKKNKTTGGMGLKRTNSASSLSLGAPVNGGLKITLGGGAPPKKSDSAEG